MPETVTFPTKFSDTSRVLPYLVTKICCILWAAFRGEGSMAILRSIPPRVQQILVTR